MSQDDTRICLGAIAGAYGVRGDVRLKSFCAVPEDVAAYGPLSSEDGAREFDISLGPPIKTGFSARLSGVTSKEEADALRGMRLFVDRARLPNLPDDEFYYSDLIGLQVFDPGGQRLGRIKDVANHGATDILEVLLDGRSDTVPVPFTQSVVPTVDLSSGRVVVDAPEGLFPDQ